MLSRYPETRVSMFVTVSTTINRVAVALQAVVAESKLTSSASPAEATSPHWSCILFQPWSAATLMGYGSNTEAVKQTTAVCLQL